MGFFLGLRRPELDVERSPPSIAEDMNEWSCTSNSHVCFHGLHSENFTFYALLQKKIAKSDYQLRHVYLPIHPSVQRERPGSQWIDFHEIGRESILLKICRGNSSFIQLRQE